MRVSRRVDVSRGEVGIDDDHSIQDQGDREATFDQLSFVVYERGLDKGVLGAGGGRTEDGRS
jgi:hypothetical protein